MGKPKLCDWKTLTEHFCTKCKTIKPVQAFRWLTGKQIYSSRCKECEAKLARNRYHYDRESKLTSVRRYRQAESGKVSQSQTRHYQKTKHDPPDYVMARRNVKRALRAGRLTREPCAICGAAAQAHHPSYLEADWLNVTWLCPAHHYAWHRAFVPERVANVEVQV